MSPEQIHNAFGFGDDKQYTVEAGTHGQISSIDESYKNQDNGLYNGYY